MRVEIELLIERDGVTLDGLVHSISFANYSGGVRPFRFQIDAGQVIAGWDFGVKCMLVGETRELRIAPQLGYGKRGKPPVPPDATLLFEIELVNMKTPE